MPVYDYLCPDCGPFTEMRPMAECDLPSRCEDCGLDAPRAFLNVPYFACMPAEQRKAQAVNEQSRHAPKTLDQYRASHGPGCGCCRPKPSRRVAKTRGGAKSFPTSRPWMISH
jgi:putative FmdB family regulatory protein